VIKHPKQIYNTFLPKLVNKFPFTHKPFEHYKHYKKALNTERFDGPEFAEEDIDLN